MTETAAGGQGVPDDPGDHPQDQPIDPLRFVVDAMDRRDPRSVLEVGAGESPLPAHLDVAVDYTGLAATAEDLEAALAACPDDEFVLADLTRLELPDLRTADLVVCLDAAAGIEDADRLNLLVRRLLALSNDVVLVAGHDTPPPEGVFAAPLSTTMILAGAKDLTAVGELTDGRIVYEARVER